MYTPLQQQLLVLYSFDAIAKRGTALPHTDTLEIEPDEIATQQYRIKQTYSAVVNKLEYFCFSMKGLYYRSPSKDMTSTIIFYQFFVWTIRRLERWFLQVLFDAAIRLENCPKKIIFLIIIEEDAHDEALQDLILKFPVQTLIMVSPF